jgi:hypothetical protein
MQFYKNAAYWLRFFVMCTTQICNNAKYTSFELLENRYQLSKYVLNISG